MIKCNIIIFFLVGYTMPRRTKHKVPVKATVETEPETKSKIIPEKVYLQYLGKEIDEDVLIEKFEFEWCKENKLTEIKNLKIYYKIDNQKVYFVVNEAATIIIDFE